jgi:hypothetical protein
MRDIVRGIWPSMLSDPVGVPRTFLALDPGCAAFAATLGFVVKPFHGNKHRCAASAATPPSSCAIVLQRDQGTHTMLGDSTRCPDILIVQWTIDSRLTNQ